MLVFDVVRLLAPVPWLSGRASASHAEGRWFDPSRDHPSELHEHGPIGLQRVTFGTGMGTLGRRGRRLLGAVRRVCRVSALRGRGKGQEIGGTTPAACLKRASRRGDGRHGPSLDRSANWRPRLRVVAAWFDTGLTVDRARWIMHSRCDQCCRAAALSYGISCLPGLPGYLLRYLVHDCR